MERDPAMETMPEKTIEPGATPSPYKLVSNCSSHAKMENRCQNDDDDDDDYVYAYIIFWKHKSGEEAHSKK